MMKELRNSTYKEVLGLCERNICLNGFSGKPEIAFYEIANQFDENTIEI